MKFWSIGTGFASLLGTGMFLLLNMFLPPKVIFSINLIIYLVGYSIGLYLLDFRDHLDKINKVEEPVISELNQVPYEDFDLENREETIEPPKTCKNKCGSVSSFFFDISFLCMGYFLAYFIGFLYVPVLAKSNLEYQISQFITRSGQFVGRLVGNYLPIHSVRMLNFLHIYSYVLIVVYTGLIIRAVNIPPVVINLTFFLSYVLIGIGYPLVYNHIYKNYLTDRDWYLGSVGQYTSFFTILGCVIGYPINQMWKNK
jgi:hypothetical protein